MKNLGDDFGAIQNIIFDHYNPVVRGDYCENAVLGLCSIPVVLKPPLKCHNGSIQNLTCVLEQIVLPSESCQVGYVNFGKVDFVNVHDSLTVKYFGTNFTLKRFHKFLQSSVEEDPNSDAGRELDIFHGVGSQSSSEDPNHYYVSGGILDDSGLAMD